MWPRGHISNRMRSASFGLRLPRQCERGPRCTLLLDQLDFARGRRRVHGSVHGRRNPCVRSRARTSCASRRAWGRHMRCWSVAMAVAVELALRRTPLDDAQKTISNIVTGSESERQKKAKLIFAGLFKTLNDERSDVMRGIERYARKQKEFSDQIRSAMLQLRELQDRPDAYQGRIDDLTNRVEWDTRIFEERRKTMNFVCEVPVLIEQRLFALARAIQQSLE